MGVGERGTAVAGAAGVLLRPFPAAPHRPGHHLGPVVPPARPQAWERASARSEHCLFGGLAPRSAGCSTTDALRGAGASASGRRQQSAGPRDGGVALELEGLLQDAAGLALTTEPQRERCKLLWVSLLCFARGPRVQCTLRHLSSSSAHPTAHPPSAGPVGHRRATGSAERTAAPHWAGAPGRGPSTLTAPQSELNSIPTRLSSRLTSKVRSWGRGRRGRPPCGAAAAVTPWPIATHLRKRIGVPGRRWQPAARALAPPTPPGGLSRPPSGRVSDQQAAGGRPEPAGAPREAPTPRLVAAVQGCCSALALPPRAGRRHTRCLLVLPPSQA